MTIDSEGLRELAAELGFWPATIDGADIELHRQHNKNADYWWRRRSATPRCPGPKFGRCLRLRPGAPKRSTVREQVHAYPATAVRELIANALIHQDLSITGTGPLIEIYDNRLEITNPGEPLVEPNMFVNAPPRSRNEKLATMLRRCGISEERGSGWDRVGFEIEFNQLPAPVVRVASNHTVVTVHGPKSVKEMTPEERLRAVYLPECLRLVMGEQLTNKTLRERFRLSEAKTPIKSSSPRGSQAGCGVTAGLSTHGVGARPQCVRSRLPGSRVSKRHQRTELRVRNVINATDCY
jgi:hypothetical protein